MFWKECRSWYFFYKLVYYWTKFYDENITFSFLHSYLMWKLEMYIRKKWSKELPNLNIVFDKYKKGDSFFCPRRFLDEFDTGKYFELLKDWKEKCKIYQLREKPHLKFWPYRHKKILGKANTIRRSVIFLCFNFLEPLSYCRYFILQVVKIFFEKMVCFNAKFGYLILNCQETISWLLDKRRENQGNCGCCQKAGCYVCNRFNYIKTELQKRMLFLKKRPVNQFCGKYMIILINKQINMTRIFIDFKSILKEP